MKLANISREKHIKKIKASHFTRIYGNNFYAVNPIFYKVCVKVPAKQLKIFHPISTLLANDIKSAIVITGVVNVGMGGRQIPIRDGVGPIRETEILLDACLSV